MACMIPQEWFLQEHITEPRPSCIEKLRIKRCDWNGLFCRECSAPLSGLQKKFCSAEHAHKYHSRMANRKRYHAKKAARLNGGG